MIQKFPLFSLILHYTLKMCWFQVENVMSFNSKITQNIASMAFLQPRAFIFIRRNKKPRAVKLEACVLIGSIENSVVPVSYTHLSCNRLYSTVTDLAKFLGLSMLQPLFLAT